MHCSFSVFSFQQIQKLWKDLTIEGNSKSAQLLEQGNSILHKIIGKQKKVEEFVVNIYPLFRWLGGFFPLYFLWNNLEQYDSAQKERVQKRIRPNAYWKVLLQFTKAIVNTFVFACWCVFLCQCLCALSKVKNIKQNTLIRIQSGPFCILIQLLHQLRY